MYANCLGVRQNHPKAVKWYHEAAQQGETSAQTNLGAMYASGIGVRQNPVVAYMWLSLSAAAGDEDAAKVINPLTQNMTSEQIAEAQRLAHEWREKHKKQ